MKTPKAIDPSRITTFELGDFDSEDQLSLIIPFKHLELFHRCVSALIEKDKTDLPHEGQTGYYLTYRGTLSHHPNVKISGER
jgi:hypothetical protein